MPVWIHVFQPCVPANFEAQKLHIKTGAKLKAMNPDWHPRNVSEHDTDYELSSVIHEDEWRVLYENPNLSTQPVSIVRRRRQIFRWHRGADSWIRFRLIRSRRWWGQLVNNLMSRFHYRRAKLLAIVYQLSRLKNLRAVENLVMKRLSRLFRTRLTPVLRLYIGDFF